MIESYSISDIGGRAENQDRALVDHALGLFAVADGMGGHRSGSMAADLAIATLRYYIESSKDRFDVSWPFGYSFDLSIDANRITTGIQLANRQVWAHSQTAPQYAGMGTTVAAMLMNDATAVIGNVGDSRVYLFRGGNLLQVSHDDTMNESPLAGLAAGEDESLMMRHVLTQAVGSQDTIEVHVCEQALRQEDLYLIASDGLHGVLEEAAIRSILGAGMGVQRTAEHLLEAAIGRQTTDNTSVILIGFDR